LNDVIKDINQFMLSLADITWKQWFSSWVPSQPKQLYQLNTELLHYCRQLTEQSGQTQVTLDAQPMAKTVFNTLFKQAQPATDYQHLAIQSSGLGFWSITRLLDPKHSPWFNKITHLNLNGNHLGDEQSWICHSTMKYLADFVRDSTRLQQLLLRHTGLANYHFQKLTEAIVEHFKRQEAPATLTELDVRDNDAIDHDEFVNFEHKINQFKAGVDVEQNVNIDNSIKQAVEGFQWHWFSAKERQHEQVLQCLLNDINNMKNSPRDQATKQQLAELQQRLHELSNATDWHELTAPAQSVLTEIGNMDWQPLYDHYAQDSSAREQVRQLDHQLQQLFCLLDPKMAQGIEGLLYRFQQDLINRLSAEK
jgi:hypothetical protein